jgi:solute carrier family 35 protein E1
VAICAATELSFTWLGFSTAMASNGLFAARAIYSKKLMNTMSAINVYNYVSMVALLFCIPPVFVFEWSHLGAGMAAAAAKVGASKFYWDLWMVGAYYHLYNQVAYQALAKVEPVTHAVGNVGKRIFVIGFSILAFGAHSLLTRLKPRGTGGLAVLGLARAPRSEPAPGCSVAPRRDG